MQKSVRNLPREGPLRTSGHTKCGNLTLVPADRCQLRQGRSQSHLSARTLSEGCALPASWALHMLVRRDRSVLRE